MSIHLQDSQGSDCVCQKRTIVRSLHAQTVRSHANVMLLLLFLVFAAGGFVGVYEGVFAIFL
jgi:hypothetical protein